VGPLGGMYWAAPIISGPPPAGSAASAQSPSASAFTGRSRARGKGKSGKFVDFAQHRETVEGPARCTIARRSACPLGLPLARVDPAAPNPATRRGRLDRRGGRRQRGKPARKKSAKPGVSFVETPLREREMDQKSRREVWLITSGIIFVPLVAALAVVVQMLQ
jgi:hypothetical protein